MTEHNSPPVVNTYIVIFAFIAQFTFTLSAGSALFTPRVGTILTVFTGALFGAVFTAAHYLEAIHITTYANT